MATAIDDNVAYEKSDKSIWRLLNIRCTRLVPCLAHLKIACIHDDAGKGIQEMSNWFADDINLIAKYVLNGIQRIR